MSLECRCSLLRLLRAPPGGAAASDDSPSGGAGEWRDMKVSLDRLLQLRLPGVLLQHHHLLALLAAPLAAAPFSIEPFQG